MHKVTIKETSNPLIIKFELEDFIVKNQSFEFKNIDETKNSPLAQQLFYLPFVKTVYISGNFIAIERFSIVEWEDVQDEVAEQIENLYKMAVKLLLKSKKILKRKFLSSIYAETHTKPSCFKICKQ